uniref:Recombination activating protein 1 n=1 Tax=Romanomermis culicivorax TaxID=13658 RepID=A0A915IMW3_ROMCU
MNDDQLENDADSSLIIQLSRDDSVSARTARFLSQILSLPQINRNENVRFLTSECALRVQQLTFERKQLSKSLIKSRQFCSKCRTLLVLGSNCSLTERASYRKKRLLSKKLQKLDKKRQTFESWHETKLEKRLRKRFDDMQNQKIMRCKVCRESNHIPLQGSISRKLKKQRVEESTGFKTPSCVIPSTPLSIDSKKKSKKAKRVVFADNSSKHL